MIREEEVYKIGVLTKTHGVSGELNLSFTDDVFDRVEAEYLVCRMDGILVPFFMTEYRFKSNSTALVTFEDIDTEEKARKMVGVEVFFPKALTDEIEVDSYTWSYFTGFEAIDESSGHLGQIVRVNDDTMNVLFEIVSPAGKDILVPACEEFVTNIAHKERKIYLNLPQGLLTLEEE